MPQRLSVWWLIERSRDRSERDREAACESLGSIKDARAIEPLIERLGDCNSDVRQAACGALNQINQTLQPYGRALLCREHWTRFEAKRVMVRGAGTANYWACRVCGRSATMMMGVKEVVAVLDEGMSVAMTFTDGILRGNWLQRQSLFDFDRVEIIRASDWDVERFCIQVGNDTDAYRMGRYRKMECAVEGSCGLDLSTINMLKSMFGSVVIRTM